MWQRSKKATPDFSPIVDFIAAQHSSSLGITGEITVLRECVSWRFG